MRLVCLGCIGKWVQARRSVQVEDGRVLRGGEASEGQVIGEAEVRQL